MYYNNLSNFNYSGIIFSIFPILFTILIVLRLITMFKKKDHNNENTTETFKVVEETTYSSHSEYINKNDKPSILKIIYTIIFATIWFATLGTIFASLKRASDSNFFYVFIIPFILAGGLVVLKAIFDIKAFVKSKNDTQNTEQTHLKTDENYYLKLCKHCGKELKPNDYFCSECGNKVE